MDQDSSDAPSFAVFEFFAGLGGFHLSLPPSLRVRSSVAVEIDRRAAECYQANVSDTYEHRDEPVKGVDVAPDGSDSGAAAAGSVAAAPPAAALSARARMKLNQQRQKQRQREAAAQQTDAKKQKIEASESGADSTEAAAVTSPSAALAADPTVAASCSAEQARDPRSSLCSISMSSFQLPPSTPPSARVRSATRPRLLVRLIEQLPASALCAAEEGVPSIWMLSPPCQPFTRTVHAKQRAENDPRNRALDFLLQTLRGLSEAQRPLHLFLENVKHFWGSAPHAALLDTLQECGYRYTQYLLSPLQIGLPNYRTRFYVAARRMHPPELRAVTEQQWARMRHTLVTTPPGVTPQVPKEEEEGDSSSSVQLNEEGDAESNDAPSGKQPDASLPLDPTLFPAAPSPASQLPTPSSLPILVPAQQLREFLDESAWHSPALRQALQLPARLLAAPWELSVVSPFDRRTYCFTGGYGRVIHKASGSFLLDAGPQVERQLALQQHPLDRSQGLRPYEGQLRFFSPMELLRLFGFPADYRFPAHFTLAHCYKLIGNSINVALVARILAHHLRHELPREPQ